MGDTLPSKQGQVQQNVTHRPLFDQPHRLISLVDGRAQESGANLRRLRKTTGLRQERFALEHGFDRTYISGIQPGARNPTIEIVQRLTDALEMDVAELFSKSA